MAEASRDTGYRFSEESIKCKLCTKPYTRPRSLPCLHSFCIECLRKYITDGFPSLKNATAKKDGSQKSSDKQSDKQTGAQSNHNTKKVTILEPNKDIELDMDDTRHPNNKSIKPTATNKPKQDGATAKPVGGSHPKPTGRGHNRIIGGNNDGLNPQTRAKGFPCPCCRKFITTPTLAHAQEVNWPELFPENKLLADLVDLHTLKRGTRTCDPCNRNKAISDIKFYCKNCRDALCETCSKTHQALRGCRHHKVLSMEQFSSEINSLKVEEDLCPKHENKVLEYFCAVHNSLCCSICINESHKACEKMSNVSETATKLKAGKDIAAIDDVLKQYKVYTDAVLKDRASQIKKLDTKKSKLLDEFITVKKHIVSQLEKMETDLKVILDSTHRNETKKIRQEAEKCNEIKTAVVNSKEMLTLAVNHGSDSQLVATIENVRSECEFYEENLGIVCSKIRAVDYEIVLDPSIQQIIKRLNQFGRIDVNTKNAQLPPTPKLAGKLGLHSTSTKAKAVKPAYALAGKQAKEIGEFCARFTGDTEECWFTGARFLPDGRIILADRTNKKLKLFTSNFTAVNELHLPSKPWDVTVISDKEVAVSLPGCSNRSSILFVGIQDSMLSSIRTISTDEPCFGIFYVSGKLLTVTYDGDPPNLKILSLTGQELTYVCVDDDGFNLFCKPVYVTCTSDASQIYVSDERLGCLVNLTETGTLNFTYSAMDLGHAAGIAIDNDGNLYICGTTSNTVHVLTPSGDRIKILITNEDISYPRAVAFEPREKKLLVTQGDKDIVKVYSVA